MARFWRFLVMEFQGSSGFSFGFFSEECKGRNTDISIELAGA
jgi:hypothetical protein